MQVALSRLPLPPNILRANVKYIGLMDVGNDLNFANVGYLVNGDFEAFVRLRNSVEGGGSDSADRREALRWLHTLYPLIGQIGDKGTGYNADVMESFINSHYKIAATTDDYVAYTSVGGATNEPAALQAAGILNTVIDLSATNKVYTQTRWAVPGSGGFVINSTTYKQAVATLLPSLCVYNRTEGCDSLITNNGATATYDAATGTPSLLQLSDLANNLAFEYDMGVTQTVAAEFKFNYPNSFAWVNYTATGEATNDPWATTNPRYRGNENRSIDGLSFRLDQNTESAVASMLDN